MVPTGERYQQTLYLLKKTKGKMVSESLLPTNFAYPLFAIVLLFNGISMGMFASPNRAAVMNSLPPGDRGAGVDQRPGLERLGFGRQAPVPRGPGPRVSQFAGGCGQRAGDGPER